MIGALKEKAFAKAMAPLETDFRARIADKIELFKSLKPTDVYGDEKYANLVVNPRLCLAIV
jgi:hypothetical protein